MNNIIDFIQEKLKIGSKSKVNEKIKPGDAAALKREVLKKIINKETDFNDIDISAVKDLSRLFEDQDISEIDISEWDVSHVESMKAMFQNCRYLKTCGDLGKWDVRNVLDMSWMFNGCSNLLKLGDLSNWDVSNKTLRCMFQGCRRLKTLGDIKQWRPKEANWEIFSGCDIKPEPRKRV